MSDPAYRGPWLRLRRQILARDNYLCQIRRPGCKTRADHVDHITPISKGGAWWDPKNLRAACGYCNVAEGNDMRRTPTPSRRW